jgi:dienelactone hydrolase
VGAVSRVGLAAPVSTSVAATPSEERSARCVRAHAPYDVGITTVNVRSRGHSLRTTIAYPATSDGEGATPVCRKSRLIVAGHGSGGDGASAANLHRYLVERGYVVAAPSFPMQNGYDFEGYAADVSRTITKARKLSNQGSGVLSNRLRGKVGYIGTSMGAIVGLELVDKDSRDKRINAVVPKAGAHYGDFRTRGGPPLLMIHGNRDTTVDYSAGKQAYRDAKRPKGLITLRGVDHDMNTGRDPIMSTASLAFFDRFLLGKKNGLRRVEKAVQQSDIATLRKRW